MKKMSENGLIMSLNTASRLGAFDKVLKSEYHRHILAGNRQRFTINCPYGIFEIKPDAKSVQEFIDLADECGVLEKSDESILDCCASREVLEKGESVVWESGRYARIKDRITLREWLSGANVTPIGIAQEKRNEVEETLNETGTNIS